MGTITIRLEQLFQGLEKSSYPGEYLDFILQEKTELQQLEEIASVLAIYRRYWNDRDATVFNNDQRMRIFSHLAKYAEESAVIAASLSVLSEADGESEHPFFKEEKRREQVKAYLLLAKSATEADSAIGVVRIRLELIKHYRELLLSFLEKAEPYKEERTLYNLANLPKKGRECLKSKLVTALNKLLDSNVTPASAAYKVLSQRFTDREIRYMNLKWFEGTNAIQDKVAAEFLSSLLIHEDSMPIHESEEKLFLQYGTKNFSRNIQGSCKPYDLLCQEYLLKGRPSVLQNERNWKLAYEIYGIEDITADRSFLKFNPMEEENFGRIFCIRKRQKQAKLINNFALKKELPVGMLIPEYTEAEKEYARNMKQVSQKLFGDEFMDVLDEYSCYDAMTFLCQTEVVPEPVKVTKWVKQLQGGYGVCCTVRICKQISKPPLWLVEMYDYKRILDKLSRKNMYGVSKRWKREYLGQLCDALYQKQPCYYVEILMRLFEEDWKWRNQKKAGKCLEPKFELEDFFSQSEIRILVSGLRNKYLTQEEKVCMNYYRMDPKGYALWQYKQKRMEKTQKEWKALLKFQNDVNYIFKRFLDNNCEAKSMDMCYWSILCDEPKIFRSLFDKVIIDLAIVRAIEKINQSGSVPELLKDMSEISRGKEGVKKIPEMIQVLENAIKEGEKNGAC